MCDPVHDCLPDTDLLQAGKIGSTAIMQLTEHDLSIYSAAHTETEVSECRLPAGMPWCLEPCAPYPVHALCVRDATTVATSSA